MSNLGKNLFTHPRTPTKLAVETAAVITLDGEITLPYARHLPLSLLTSTLRYCVPILRWEN